MDLEEKCVFKKIADKHPELNPNTKPEYVMLAKECFACKGYRSNCTHYLYIAYSKNTNAQLSLPAP